MLNIPIAPVNDQRRPFVHFEEREYGRNEEASLAAGRPVPNVGLFAVIHPVGSKDSHEKLVSDWLVDIRNKASRGAMSHEWLTAFEKDYEAYTKGHELPREGTPVKTWQMINAEPRVRLIALGLTTVEDLAAVPDSGLSTIGLDGRVLRDTAKAWITEAKDKGAVAQELATANQRIAELEERNKGYQAQIDELRSLVIDTKKSEKRKAD